MDKILKPFTIIPTDLYVQRDADRQIRNIISDMGRPGYVLVSRQMGKTNLLLNAKRRLETQDDIFVYIDLSNPFDDAKSCFENIVDIILDTNAERFEHLFRDIQEKRPNFKDTPAHKQHTNELRQVLRSIKGKLVIILDEIDALTKTKYSDQVFSQIRSIYFSRVNFPEFERLTYILSGVVEPTEIIKDPKISPFNIGQKIFLNDFNSSEFEQFLINSKLNLSRTVVERIFFWTNGNPRMTWDVCSEVENLLDLREIQASDIDKIVRDQYLTTFDKPPIDNIRELVKNDRDIRNAIVEIEFKKGKEVSDRTKSKLYLAGIINYNDSDIQLKNQIIKQSLTLEWIRSLEQEEKGLITMAIELAEKNQHGKSLELFEQFLQNSDFDEAERSLCFYYMGYSSYHTSNFPKALEYLEKARFDREENSRLFFLVLNLKGLSHFYLNKTDQSLQSFKEVISCGRHDEFHARALLNYSSVALASGKAELEEEALTFLRSIIDETGINAEKIKESILRELKATGYYNLARNEESSDHISEAVHYYRAAKELGQDGIKPSIILALTNILSSEEEKSLLFEELVGLIEEGKIHPVDKNLEKPLEFSFDDFKDILIALFTQNKDLFARLKNKLYWLGDKSLYIHLYELGLFALGRGSDLESVGDLLEGAYQEMLKQGKIAEEIEIAYNTLKLLSYFNFHTGRVDRSAEYIKLFEDRTIDAVDYIDFDIFSNAIIAMIRINKYDTALKYAKIINAVKEVVNHEFWVNYLAIYNFELNIFYRLGLTESAVKKAKEILSMAGDEKIINQKSNLLGDTGFSVVVDNAKAFLEPSSKLRVPTIADKKYGRNDLIKVRYKDGAIVENKYKRLEADILAGKCQILR